MRTRVTLTEEHLLSFLAGSGLPLVSRLVAIVQWLSLGLAVANGIFAAFALARWRDAFWNAELPWAGALPALACIPLHLAAWWLARVRRMHSAALMLFLGLYLFSILAAWPRGVFVTAWYLQPLLALLATCCLGVVPGMLLAMVAVIVLMLIPAVPNQAFAPELLADVWAQRTNLAALTLASALTGALLHKLLFAALHAAEAQRHEHRDALRALRYRERLLRHALRVETVGDLASMVTHQLRNAYQVMIGHVTLGGLGSGKEQAERLALVGEALQQSRPLLDHLMSLSHPDEGKPELADLGSLVATFVDRAKRVMPQSVRVELAATAERLPVLVNPIGLDQALWNLAINARQAMPEGGRLVLRTGQDGTTCWVSVSDDGCGIPTEIQPRVFDPYFTTKPPGEGTGLGLAAVDRFVRSCRGRVLLDSQVGRGTTFRLIFPAVDPSRQIA